MRILVVEDDMMVARLVRAVLSADGYAVDIAATGEEGRLMAFINDYDGIVLDLHLNDRHGLTILQELRREGRQTPVLILTGSSGESDMVRALDAGADEYVVKPVRNRELAARVRALVRRGAHSQRSEQLTVGALVLNRLTRRVLVGGEVVELSPREFALLEHLLLHTDEVVTRSDLLEKVWDMNFDPGSNVVDVHVARLRRKLAAADAPVVIQTVRGVGFRLVPAVVARDDSGRNATED
ncbi:MAG: response regulator transcription factor [Gemmatimonadaceae bacterium]